MKRRCLILPILILLMFVSCTKKSNGIYDIYLEFGSDSLTFSEEEKDNVNPYFYLDKKTFLYGIKNGKGKIIAQPKWAYVSKFSDGYAAVTEKFYDGDSHNDNWGYIDEKGEYVIEPLFEQAGDFVNGIAEVQILDIINVNDGGEEYGEPKYTAYFIDKSGNLHPTEYGENAYWLRRLNDNYFVCSVRYEYLAEISQATGIYNIFSECVVDMDGKKAIGEMFSYVSEYPEINLFIGTKRFEPDENNGESRYERYVYRLDTLEFLYVTDEINFNIIEYGVDEEKAKKYTSLHKADGYYIGYYQAEADPNGKSKTILLDANLDPVSGEEYDYISDFYDGLAAVFDKDKMGFIDRSGNYAIPLSDLYYGNFFNGIAPVIDFEGKEGYFINKSGERIEVTSYEYDEYATALNAEKKHSYSRSPFPYHERAYFANPNVENKIIEYLDFVFRSGIDMNDFIEKEKGNEEGYNEMLKKCAAEALYQYNLFRADNEDIMMYEEFIRRLEFFYGKDMTSKIDFKKSMTEEKNGVQLEYDEKENSIRFYFPWCGTGLDNNQYSYIPLSIGEEGSGIYKATVIPVAYDGYTMLYDKAGNKISSYDLYFDTQFNENRNYNEYFNNNSEYYFNQMVKEAKKNKNSYLQLIFTVEVTSNGLVYLKDVSIQ